jgi:ribosomal-protein-alanine N-acetyltransferase
VGESRLQSIRALGEKVVLRPHVESDAEPAFELVHAREPILRWLIWKGPEKMAELRSTYARWLVAGEEASDYHFAIVERESEQLIGSIGVRFAGHPRTGDVGYWLGEPFWGRGYVTEAVELVSHVAFEHLGAEVLCAWVFVGNEASRIVLERNGYSLVRTVRGRVRQGADAQDEWYYTLLRSEWERSRGESGPRIDVDTVPGPSPGE